VTSPDHDTAPGCALTAYAAGVFIVIAAIETWIGLAIKASWLVFAALPVSAVFTVVSGRDLVVAWPLDLLLWVTLGAFVAARAARHGDDRSIWLRWVGGVWLTAAVLGAVLGAGVSIR